MAGHGGKRNGAGRKRKTEEQAIIEKLSPLDELAMKSLKNGLRDGQPWATKMYFEYVYGKPKDVIHQTTEITIPEFTWGE